MRKYYPVLIIALLVIALDQVAKWWVVNNMLLHDPMPIVEAWQPYLQLTRTTNTGFAFGLATGGSAIILVLSSLVTIVLLGIIVQTDESERLQIIAFSIIIGGALGNIIDRIRLGHVVDFVHVYIPGVISNVSNFADHAVVIGVGILILDTFLQERRKAQNPETEVTGDNIVPAVED